MKGGGRFGVHSKLESRLGVEIGQGSEGKLGRIRGHISRVKRRVFGEGGQGGTREWYSGGSGGGMESGKGKVGGGGARGPAHTGLSLSFLAVYIILVLSWKVMPIYVYIFKDKHHNSPLIEK